MPISPETSQVLFKHEYEQELESWLRQRFAYLCIAYVVIEGVLLIITVLTWLLAVRQTDQDRTVLTWVASLVGPLAIAVQLGIVARYYFSRRSKLEGREDVLAAATQMILFLGAVSLGQHFALKWIDPGSEVNPYWSLFFWHISACAFLPWTPRESLRPMVPLLLAWDTAIIITRLGEDADNVLWHVLFNPGILLPGWAICAWRLNLHTEHFRARMVGKHFLTMRQELQRARGVHESMFPSPYNDGHVRFEYAFNPMRELGGDFVHLQVSPEGLMHLTLIDVTGHGLSAALTVNRLYGELERLRAESPRLEPGELLSMLNRYIFLTMSRHQIYATALAITIDPYVSRVHWASAGHPPAFLRGANGVVTAMQSTAMMLGAVSDDVYEMAQQSLELSPGDVIVLYTDGAFEARDRRGKQLGIEQIRGLLQRQPPPRNWAQFIASYVNKYTAGPAADDVLVASITYLAARKPHAMESAGSISGTDRAK